MRGRIGRKTARTEDRGTGGAAPCLRACATNLGADPPIHDVNRMVVDLGVLLKNTPGYDFSIESFADRLRLQKTVYLLQAFGIYLGYDFSWYLRGPYCPSLAINAFALNDLYNKIPDIAAKFGQADKQRLFDRFRALVKGKDVDELEMLALLHYLKQTGASEREARSRTESKQEYFTHEKVERMWQELEARGLV